MDYDYDIVTERNAGRYCQLSRLFAAIVLANNATILLAVNRVAAFRPHSTNRWHYAWLITCCRGSVGRAWEHEVVGSSPTRDRFFHMFLFASAYSVGAELSYLGFGWEGNSNTAQP